MIILIDNYDSFTFNLYHYLGELGAETVVHRNDQISVGQVLSAGPEAIVLSPGPCTPNEAGICLDLVKAANPAVGDIDVIVPGNTVTFPSLEPAAMVHRTAAGTYAVTVVTAPSATSPEVDRVRSRIAGRNLTLDLIPVRLARDLTAVRVVVQGFADRAEAAAFYRAAAPVGAAATRPAGRRS